MRLSIEHRRCHFFSVCCDGPGRDRAEGSRRWMRRTSARAPLGKDAAHACRWTDDGAAQSCEWSACVSLRPVGRRHDEALQRLCHVAAVRRQRALGGGAREHQLVDLPEDAVSTGDTLPPNGAQRWLQQMQAAAETCTAESGSGRKQRHCMGRCQPSVVGHRPAGLIACTRTRTGGTAPGAMAAHQHRYPRSSQ